MTLIAPQQAIATHIISGFLGAGKTTLLQHVLAQKPAHEVWAVLMNEFGQIGVDQQLLPNQQDIVIHELLGGCLCCSSQLPMQMALMALLKSKKIDRLWIEPTGLGHPAQLLEQLSEPQWQMHLQLRSPITVLDGSRLHDQAWSTQHLYQEQLKAAKIIVVSHQDRMTDADHQALQHLQAHYQVYAPTWLLTQHGQLSVAELDQDYQPTQRLMQPLLHLQQANRATAAPIRQLPYHYVEQAQGYHVAGWKLPKRWQFDANALLDVLCEQQNWLRIKAIFNTDQGWKSFNFNPERFNYQSCAEGVDNRLEIITQQSQQWQEFEQQLLDCQISSAKPD